MLGRGEREGAARRREVVVPARVGARKAVLGRGERGGGACGPRPELVGDEKWTGR